MSRSRWAIEPAGEYPSNWEDLAAEAKERAGYRCEHCGMEFHQGSNKAVRAVNADGKPTILTVHHLSGDKADCSWENLLVCCQRCHLHIQALWGPGDALPPIWEVPPAWLIVRGLAWKPSMQMRMF